MTQRFELHEHPVAGFLITDTEGADPAEASIEINDEALARRVVRLLNEEEHFRSQEPIAEAAAQVAAYNGE